MKSENIIFFVFRSALEKHKGLRMSLAIIFSATVIWYFMRNAFSGVDIRNTMIVVIAFVERRFAHPRDLPAQAFFVSPPGSKVFEIPRGILFGGRERCIAFLGFLGGATESISLHSCFVMDGRDPFVAALVNLLIKKENEGVSIRLVVDGCMSELTGPGVVPPSWLRHVGDRSKWSYHNPTYHRKFCIVDRKMAMVTGANLESRNFSGSSQPLNDIPRESAGDRSGILSRLKFSTQLPALEDADVYISDPLAVGELLALEGEVTGHRETSKTVHPFHSGGGNTPPSVRVDCFRLLTQLTESSKERIVIFTGLFDPDKATLQLIHSASARGVSCTLVLDAALSSHFRESIEYLVAGGVNVRVYGTSRDTLHAKVWRVDDEVWLGSCNLTRRSMNNSHEMMVRCEDAIDSFEREVYPRVVAASVPWQERTRTWQDWRVCALLNSAVAFAIRGVL